MVQNFGRLGSQSDSKFPDSVFVHDIPLAYIIQDWDHQPGNTYDSFEEEVIAKTPHSGTSYDEDRMSTNIKVAINLKKSSQSRSNCRKRIAALKNKHEDSSGSESSSDEEED